MNSAEGWRVAATAGKGDGARPRVTSGQRSQGALDRCLAGLAAAPAGPISESLLGSSDSQGPWQAARRQEEGALFKSWHTRDLCFSAFIPAQVCWELKLGCGLYPARALSRKSRALPRSHPGASAPRLLLRMRSKWNHQNSLP